MIMDACVLCVCVFTHAWWRLHAASCRQKYHEMSWISQNNVLESGSSPSEKTPKKWLNTGQNVLEVLEWLASCHIFLFLTVLQSHSNLLLHHCAIISLQMFPNDRLMTIKAKRFRAANASCVRITVRRMRGCHVLKCELCSVEIAMTKCEIVVTRQHKWWHVNTSLLLF